MTDGNTEDFAFALQSAYNYSVFVEGGSIYEAGRSLVQIYSYLQYASRDGAGSTALEPDVFWTSDGSSITQVAREEYVKAVSAYSATKTAPFGTQAGSLFFGAQGVWLQGMATAEQANRRLTDHGGTLRTPYTSVTVTVSNTRADDTVNVAPQDGSTSEPDLDQFASHGSNNAQGDSTFELVSGSFPNDTPESGAFFAIDVSANERHRYRYDSYSGGTLTLPTKRTGTADGATTGQTLIDSGATFVTHGIQRGDIIRNTTDSGWGYVISVDSETQLTTTHLTTSGRDWASGDGYELNALVVTYTGSDTLYVPYVDTIEDTGSDVSPGSVAVTLPAYVSDRGAVITVRNVTNSSYEIKEFQTTQNITSAGLSVAVIRNPDTVVA
jgi:hypothetical protein